jgi:hypothetical protein
MDWRIAYYYLDQDFDGLINIPLFLCRCCSAIIWILCKKLLIQDAVLDVGITATIYFNILVP